MHEAVCVGFVNTWPSAQASQARGAEMRLAGKARARKGEAVMAVCIGTVW